MSYLKVYLIYNPVSNRTYIGATTDVKRRLRQHRREIVGGARSTHKFHEHWTLVCYLDGFKSKSEAMRWEKLLKLRSWGKKERISNFKMVGRGICPPGKVNYEVPENIIFQLG